MRDKGKIKLKRWAYLAGLIDGDGSFSIRYDKRAGYQLCIAVYSTSKLMINWLEHVFGGQHRKMPTKGNRKQKYCWYTYNENIARFVSPFLIIKYLQGQTVLQFLAMGSERNADARKDLKATLSLQNKSFTLLNKEETLAVSPEAPTKYDFAYLAGLFDAEGSFSVHRKNSRGNGEFTSAARISNTDGIVFPWIVARFGGGFSVTKRKTRDEGTWLMNGQNREKHTLAVVPYLVIKKQRASIFLEWIRHNRSWTRDKKILQFEIMKKLNQRGISPEANTLRPQNTEDKIESNPYSDIGCEPAVMLAS